MQNILGNILSYMDAYEKSAHASANGEYLLVVEELGRAIHRSLIFDSMLTEGDDGTIFYHQNGTTFVESGQKHTVENSPPRQLEEPFFHTMVQSAADVKLLEYMHLDLNPYADLLESLGVAPAGTETYDQTIIQRVISTTNQDAASDEAYSE
jgi:hypothetical protein